VKTNRGPLPGSVNVTLSNGQIVLVRQLPITDYPAYLGVQTNEMEMIRMLTGREIENPDDALLILEEGDRINADFFARWLNGEAARVEVITGDGAPRWYHRSPARMELIVPGNTTSWNSLPFEPLYSCGWTESG